MQIIVLTNITIGGKIGAQQKRSRRNLTEASNCRN